MADPSSLCCSWVPPNWHSSSLRKPTTSSWPLILTASAFASLGLPCGHRLLWARLDLPFLLQLLAEMLIPFHGCKISDPELFPQGCQPPSCLHKAHGIRIAQHRRADGRPGEPRSLAQPLKQEGETIFSQRMPPLGEQEPIPRLWHCGLPGRRETGLIQIGAHGALPVRRQGDGAGASPFPAHRHRSAGAVDIREA
jgi:hypothetical protein